MIVANSALPPVEDSFVSLAVFVGGALSNVFYLLSFNPPNLQY